MAKIESSTVGEGSSIGSDMVERYGKKREHAAGKGDSWRSIDMDTYRSNFDSIFTKKKKK